MKPYSLGEVGHLFTMRDAHEILLASYAVPCVATLHARVPLPTWPNAAANEPHFFGPLDRGP
jgi:hypothetical protein